MIKVLTQRHTTAPISDDSIYRKYRYIVFDIDILYRIVSYRRKNIKFFDVSRYFTPEVYIFITALPK